MDKENRVNNPKPRLLQLFCKHSGEWFTQQSLFHNISGETHYKVCTKCGKILDQRFIPY